MIHISRVYGGPELANSKIDRAISKVIRLRGAGEEDQCGSLDIEFHVPGSIVAPEHSGIRTGRLSKKRRMLALQVAVPREILDKDEPDIEAFLLLSLRAAVRIATPVFERARIPYDETSYLNLLDTVGQSLRN